MARKFTIIEKQVTGKPEGLGLIEREMKSRDSEEVVKFRYEMFLDETSFGKHIATILPKAIAGDKVAQQELWDWWDAAFYGVDLNARAGNRPEGEASTVIVENKQEKDILTHSDWPRTRLVKYINAALSVGKSLKGFNAFMAAKKALEASGEGVERDGVFHLAKANAKK